MKVMMTCFELRKSGEEIWGAINKINYHDLYELYNYPCKHGGREKQRSMVDNASYTSRNFPILRLFSLSFEMKLTAIAIALAIIICFCALLQGYVHFLGMCLFQGEYSSEGRALLYLTLEL
jgi:hypothetical protein